jgi:transcriptional regulator with XRE-family HTH domain
MRRSPQRHPLAVLRLKLGLGQKEMAALLKCSRPTIQAVELGKLKLSEHLAHEIAIQTGVSLDWLLGGDPTGPPQSQWPGAYTVEEFERVQADLVQPRTHYTDLEYISEFYLDCVSRLGETLLASIRADRYPIYRYRLRQLLQSVEQELGTWPAIEESRQTSIDVAVSYFPPETSLVTEPVARALKKLIREKQKQKRAARPRKNRPASP